jgi:hypothetical protein
MHSIDRRHRLANPNTRAALAILRPSSPSSDSHQFAYNFRIFTSDDFPLRFISIILSALFTLARRFGGPSSWPNGIRGGDFRNASLYLRRPFHNSTPKSKFRLNSFSTSRGSSGAPAVGDCFSTRPRTTPGRTFSIYSTVGFGVIWYHTYLISSHQRSHDDAIII